MMEECIYKEEIFKLIDSVPRIEEKINSLVLTVAHNDMSIAANTVVISNLVLAQAKMNGMKDAKKEEAEREKIAVEFAATKRRDKLQRRFLTIMAIIASVGLTLTAYFGFKNSKVPAQVKESIDNMEGISKVTRDGYLKYNDQGLSDSIKIK